VVSPQQSSFTLQQAAAALDIEPWRMSRLGRYLRIDVDDKCIPHAKIESAGKEDSADKRYMVVVNWLLGELRTRHHNGRLPE
jgi:hypothetical protein